MKRIALVLAVLALFPSRSFSQVIDEGDLFITNSPLERIMSPPPHYKVTKDSCAILATINMKEFADNMGHIREEYLVKDNSTDFYANRPYSVLAFVMINQLASEISFGFFGSKINGITKATRCEFILNAKAPDIYGNDEQFKVASWSLDKKTYDKINIKNFLVINFGKIATKFNLTQELLKRADKGDG